MMAATATMMMTVMTAMIGGCDDGNSGDNKGNDSDNGGDDGSDGNGSNSDINDQGLQ